MDNPFAVLKEEIRIIIKEAVSEISSPAKKEILTETQLCERLQISRSTCSLWRKKKKIPFFRVGDAIRFDLEKVLLALEGAAK